MGKYPSSLTMKEMFQLEREELAMALKGQIKCGATEHGFEWCPGDKEEVHGVIWEIFRNAEYWAMEMAASARALERLAEKYGIGITSEHFKEYMTMLMEEEGRL